MDIQENSVKLVGDIQTMKVKRFFSFSLIEYFQCQTNGRFADRYNCDKGKYFECVYQGQDGATKDGVILSRSCPVKLRFNVLIDGCDYPSNVHCN